MPIIEQVYYVIAGGFSQFCIQEFQGKVVVLGAFANAIEANPGIASFFRVCIRDWHALTEQQGIGALPGIRGPYIAAPHALLQFWFASPVEEIQIALGNPLFLDRSKLLVRDGGLVISMNIG